MILIVDDDAIYLNLVRRAAQMENLQAQVLTIDQAEKFRPTVLEYTQQIQAIVLDINLGAQEDGIDLATWLLHQDHLKPHIWLQSFEPSGPDQNRARQLGLEVNQKVSSFASLRQKLRELLKL